MNDDGTGTRQLTHDKHTPLSGGSISKDESTLIVTSGEGTRGERSLWSFFKIDRNSDSLKLLFKMRQYGSLLGPQLSPDAKKIAYSVKAIGDIGPCSVIYIMNNDGSDVKQLTQPCLDIYVSDWSNDGSSLLAYTTHNNEKDSSAPFGEYGIIANYDLNGNIKRIWEDTGYSYEYPKYSHSGKFISFRCKKTHNQETYWDVFVLDLDHDSTRDLIKDHKLIFDFHPEFWSPDDKMILCEVYGNLVFVAGKKNVQERLAKVDISTGQIINITPDFENDNVYCRPIAWVSNSRSIKIKGK